MGRAGRRARCPATPRPRVHRGLLPDAFVAVPLVGARGRSRTCRICSGRSPTNATRRHEAGALRVPRAVDHRGGRRAARRARRRGQGARGWPEPRAAPRAAARHLRPPRRSDSSRRAAGHRTAGRDACGSAQPRPKPRSSRRLMSRKACRCSPAPHRSSVISRSAIAAPSAARSRTPTPPPSTPPSR